MSQESLDHDRLIRAARAEAGWVGAIESATEDDAMELLVLAFGELRNDIFNQRAKAGRAKFASAPWRNEDEVQEHIDGVYPVEPDMQNVRDAFTRQ